jgi:hypothetical protein
MFVAYSTLVEKGPDTGFMQEQVYSRMLQGASDNSDKYTHC